MGLISDHVVVLATKASRRGYPQPLRRVRYRDPETKKRFSFLTNNFTLPALTIALLYKSRWQVELLFKWIKQHLRIKAFYGVSENAVKTQVWIALSVYGKSSPDPVSTRSAIRGMLMPRGGRPWMHAFAECATNLIPVRKGDTIPQPVDATPCRSRVSDSGRGASSPTWLGEVTVPTGSLRRWLAREPAPFRAVDIVADPDARAAPMMDHARLVIQTARGHRLEGLDVASAVAVLRALEATA